MVRFWVIVKSEKKTAGDQNLYLTESVKTIAPSFDANSIKTQKMKNEKTRIYKMNRFREYSIPFFEETNFDL